MEEAQKKLTDAQAKLNMAEQAADTKNQALVTANKSLDTANDTLSNAQEALRYDWVQFPPALLALAGIAFSAGVFSSLIATTTGEEVSAVLKRLRLVDRDVVIEALKTRRAQKENPPALMDIIDSTEAERRQAKGAALAAAEQEEKAAETAKKAAETNLKAAQDASASAPADADLQSKVREAEAADASAGELLRAKREARQRLEAAQGNRESERSLVIAGTGLQKQGRVRINGQAAVVRDWAEDGTAVTVDLSPREIPIKTLVVDTANGKLAHKVGGTPADLIVGEPIQRLELSDLFREDKNPDHFDLMKFQMFGWTAVAIVVYMYLFLKDLNPNITTLPLVDSTIVILTGLSSTGYLASKGVSSVPKTQGAR